MRKLILSVLLLMVMMFGFTPMSFAGCFSGGGIFGRRAANGGGGYGAGAGCGGGFAAAPVMMTYSMPVQSYGAGCGGGGFDSSGYRLVPINPQVTPLPAAPAPVAPAPVTPIAQYQLVPIQGSPVAAPGIYRCVGGVCTMVTPDELPKELVPKDAVARLQESMKMEAAVAQLANSLRTADPAVTASVARLREAMVLPDGVYIVVHIDP